MKKLLAPLLLFLSAASGMGQPASNPDLFLAALRKREAAVKVVDITFAMKETRLKDSPIPKAEMLDPKSKMGTSLPEDLVLESTNRLVIQGTMTRYEGAHPVWQVEIGKPLPHRALNVTNSKGAKMFYPEGMGGRDTRPRGAIPLAPSNHYLQMPYTIPLGLAYRGLDRNFTSSPTQLFKPSPTRQRIGERECIEYACQPAKDFRKSYFVDPQLDHNFVRILSVRQGKVTMQTDITYARNAVCEWVPDSWVVYFYTDAGKLQRRTEVRVVSSKFNEPLPDDQFDVVFPPGTRVWKASESQYYRVQADGSFRLLSTTGEDTPTVVAREDAPWNKRYLGWVAGCVGVIAVVAVLVLERVRRGSR
jgi:hypothetical protein